MPTTGINLSGGNSKLWVSVRQSRGGKSRKGGVNISRISNRSDEYTGQSKDSDRESSKASQEIE